MKRLFLLPAIGGLLLAACGGETAEELVPPTNMAMSTVEADFSLQDVNESSPTFGMNVSPRDHLEKVSGWYFGHAT